MNQRTKQVAAKYRPVLTATQIQKILALAKTEIPLSIESISIISTLAPFAAKIENAGIVAAYSTSPAKPKVGSLESLGGTASPVDDTLSKEEYWELCHSKYNSQPENCSLAEIEGAQEYRYLNGLMSAEEAITFEEQGV